LHDDHRVPGVMAATSETLIGNHGLASANPIVAVLRSRSSDGKKKDSHAIVVRKKYDADDKR